MPKQRVTGGLVKTVRNMASGLPQLKGPEKQVPATDIQVKYLVPSSRNDGSFYEVTESDGGWQCSCWSFRRSADHTCKHIGRVR